MDPLELALSMLDEDDLPPEGERNKHLDFSRVDAFLSCRKLYKLSYLDRLPRQSNIGANFGIVQHAVCEGLVKEAVEAEHVGPLSTARAEQLHRRSARAYRLPRQMSDSALASVRTFARRESQFDHRKILGVEKKLSVDGIIRYRLVGKIDRIDRTGETSVAVIDYKGGKLWDQQRADESMQLGIYELLVRAVWPWVTDVELVLWFLQHDKKIVTRRSPQQLAELKAQLEAIGDTMERLAEFPPSPGPRCLYCDHRDRCASAWVKG